MRKTALYTLISFGLLAACSQPVKNNEQSITKQPASAPAKKNIVKQTAMTLPVIDALFYDPAFSRALKDSADLSGAEIEKLKTAAHASLRDLSEDGVDQSSAKTATEAYRQKVEEILGTEKAAKLNQIVNERYSKGVEGLAYTQPNAIPKDTRIVVNAPAFRMDVFKDGQLLKSYKISIGYPEFPLPTGMRRADTLIFNPSWTPPDEPWVKGKFSPGQKVSGASELNPLGVIKIPIGMPSLIHGGKPTEKIGNFGSHGCIGLTNPMVQDFTALIAGLGGIDLTAAQIRQMKSSKTKSMLLKTPVPIDLRYETIVAETDGLHIFRDVYERGTNTLKNVKMILKTQGLNYETLSEQEQTAIDQALEEMNTDAKGKAIAADSLPPAKNGVPASKLSRSKQGKVTQRLKGEKETVIQLSGLQGKGYPAAINNPSGA